MKTNINDPLWPSINPGDFRHQIALLSPVTGIDASGAVTAYQQPSPPVTAWAKIDYLRGVELIKAGQDASQTFMKVTAWFRSDFTVNSRLQLPSGSQVIIQYIENVREMNIFMVMTCLALGANQ